MLVGPVLSAAEADVNNNLAVTAVGRREREREKEREREREKERESAMEKEMEK